ncbi:hypothetical protein [Chryseobacterium profundimaris]|uniref:Uncharacterized protein n=1 Tax=Chryseobacterium profundimaris TaxID=1387275 RepID=A0ABY1NSG5_9FLAO|nr:hypothetical protein [Chryseobacterium profundimaris]SMP16420.1 hypothetical protein SAMN06264346_10437 [Chryseobacterium profundimaris]
MINLNTLEREIQALRMKRSRIEKKQREENAEVWSRIATLEQLAKENKSGVDAGNHSPSTLISLNKTAQRRGWK